MSALLEVTKLSVRFGGLLAVDDLALVVQPGTVCGLIGPNGAGKTTTIDALSGFVPTATGSVTLDGHDIGSLPAHQRARAGLARTFQSVELFDDLSVRENLLVAAAPARWWSPFLDAAAPKRSSRGVDIDFALELMEIEPLAAARPTELSYGQRRLAGVARALASRPKVLLLDEPAAGLDATETAALGALLRTLPNRGVGVVLIDHDMTLMFNVCDEITVLDFGRVIASGAPAAVRSDPTVIAAYLGDAS